MANAGVGIADLARARFVLATSASVRVPPTWLPTLRILKIAGAVGIPLGLLGAQPIAIAAAIGLILFFVGAVVAHLRARALRAIVGPGRYLALAVASLILLVAR
ncbi:hypothetical protein GCM10023322_57460 [Rugosimonospora acidiphila]|uniref:DoxX-like family protein n=1 Tax=Rugosimonospora acidiphila TaxID=556531 RepID=A0ABP9SC69_9ACTN